MKLVESFEEMRGKLLGPPAPYRPAISESCIHQWEQDPTRFMVVCSLCGQQQTELDAYRGVRSPRVNTGRMVAEAWEKVVGRHHGDMVNDYLSKAFEEAGNEFKRIDAIADSLDVNRVEVFNRPNIQFAKDYMALERGRQKLLNAALYKDGKR